VGAEERELASVSRIAGTESSLMELSGPELASQFHHFHPELCDLDTRKAVLGRLRTECPVGRSDAFGGFWVITRHADQQRIFKTPEVFSSTVPIVPRLDGVDMLMSIPMGLDGDAHRAYRRVLSGAFTRDRVRALEPELRRYTRELAHKFASSTGAYDFRYDFAVKVPAFGFLRIMGLPSEDLDQLVQFNEWLMRHQLSEDEAVREQFQTVETPLFVSYVREHFEARRRPTWKRDDLLTRLVRAQVFGRDVTFEEVAAMVGSLIAAGLDTTTNQMSMHMEFFARNQERWHELIDHPERIPTAVEELLRCHGIVSPGRILMDDAEVGGQCLHTGDLLVMVTAGSSYDEEANRDAERIDFQREQIRHNTFGGGNHMCIGAALARFTLQVAYEELTRAVPRFRIAATTAPEHHVGVVMGVKALELEVVDDRLDRRKA
jgi:cytochrome P450